MYDTRMSDQVHQTLKEWRQWREYGQERLQVSEEGENCEMLQTAVGDTRKDFKS